MSKWQSQKFAACDHCGRDGLVKLAFDQQRWLCLPVEPCFQIGNQKRLASIGGQLTHSSDQIIDVVSFLADVYGH